MNRSDSQDVRHHERIIRTPEGVTFALPLSGPLSRFLAWLVDAACLLAATKVIGLLVNLVRAINPDLSQAFSIILFFAVSIGYGIVLEWYWNGQTFGKRVVGLRVMDIRGLRLRPGQIVIRNLLRAVDSLPLCYLLGGTICLISRYSQRLGDLAGNTIVVRTTRLPEPRIDLILNQTRYNSLRDHPRLVARLRQQISPKEADIALRALARRDELEPVARVDLFQAMADLFKQKVAFPKDTVTSISDEQYIRNVVDLLYKKE
jgi:uncharacterized RDD family membrane protein YckC